MTAAFVIATLLLADLLVLGLLALLAHRRNRRSFDQHVDGALDVLGTRRPQDAIDRRWP